jgi:hypothetical protein
LLDEQGKLAEALDFYRNSVAISDQWSRQGSSEVEWQNLGAGTRYCMAKALMLIKDGDRDEARRLVAEGIAIVTRLEHQGQLVGDAQDTLNKLNELANALSLPSTE